MSESSFTLPNLSDMAEANRLTQAGRFEEATALIQRSLGGLPGARTAPGARPAPAGDVHAALQLGSVRDALGRAWREIGPSLKGVSQAFKPGGPQGGPQARPRSAPQRGDGRFAERSFSNAAGSRAYRLFVPTARGSADDRRPLLVMLHGCTQSPEDFAAGTRMNALAEDRGWYVAYPGQTRGANMQKCWNWFEPGDQGRERGESGVIAGLARAVAAEHPIDPARIYIAGLSAGGAAAVNIARAYPDLFAGVGIHSGLAAGCARDLGSAMMAMQNGAPGGALPGGADGFGAPASAEGVRVPTIVFHGEGDGTVSPRNGEAVLAQAGIAGLRPQAEGGGSGTPRPYTRTRYRDAAGKVQAEAWMVRGAGHAWFGGSSEGSYTDPAGPDASRAMLDFFEDHRLGEGRA